MFLFAREVSPVRPCYVGRRSGTRSAGSVQAGSVEFGSPLEKSVRISLRGMVFGVMFQPPSLFCRFLQFSAGPSVFPCRIHKDFFTSKSTSKLFGDGSFASKIY